MKAKIHYKEFSDMYDFDFEVAYIDKLRGFSWNRLAHGRVSETTMKVMMEEWCRDNHKDFEILKKNGAGIISDPTLADKGKILALRKARWSIKEIAVDCHCTEECVKEILNGTT